MSFARTTSIGLCAVLTGCALDSITFVAPDLPRESELIAVVTRESGSGLLEADSARFETALRELPQDSEVFVVGYSRDDFRNYVLPDQRVLRSNPVRLALPGEQRLPRPRTVLAGRVSGTVVQLDPSDAEIDLTSGWLPDCPPLLPLESTQVYFPCFGRPCPLNARQLGCEIAIESTELCPDIDLMATVDASGAVEFQSPEFRDRCDALPESDEGAALTVRCAADRYARFFQDGCEVQILSSAEPEIVLTGNERVLSDFYVDSLADDSAGALSDVVALDDRVIVAHFPDGWNGSRCLGRSSEVFILDSETLETRQVIADRRCLAFAEKDPAGDGFIAIEGEDTDRRLVRFSKDGAEQSELALPILDGGYTTGLEVDPSSGRVAVLQRSGAARGPASAVLLSASFVEIGTSTPAVHKSNGRSVLFLEDGRIGLFGDQSLEQGGEVIHLFDPETLRESGVIDARLRCGKVEGSRLAYDSTRQSVFIASPGLQNTETLDGVIELDQINGAGGCALTTFSEWEASPRVLLPLSSRPGLIAVSVDRMVQEEFRVYRPQGPAGVAILDPTLGRFFSGASDQGPGAVTRMSEDAQGRIFGIVPFSAKVFRLEITSS